MSIIKASIKWRKPLIPLTRVEKLIQHTMAHSTADIPTIHSWHLQRDGGTWAGFGYNYWIAKDGTIYEGRGMHVGAQTSGWNSKSLGIGYQGDFTKPEMTDAQVKSGAWLNAKFIKDFNLTIDDVVGHNKYANKECPGRHFRWNDLRKEINVMLGQEGDGEVLKYGDKGDEVAAWQGKLVKLGYDLGNYGPKKDGIDGDFGPTTQRIVQTFQKDNNLPVTGEIDVRTMVSIEVNLAGGGKEVAELKKKVTVMEIQMRDLNDRLTKAISLAKQISNI